MPVQFSTTGTIPVTSPTAGSNPPVSSGKQNDVWVSEMHGKYYTAAYSGNVFLCATLAAGIVVPFIAATMASKFSLYNPATSGRVVELIDINLLQVPGTALITGCAMAFQGPLAQTGGVPGTLTVSAGGNASARIGSGITPQSTLYTAATLTNVAIANLSPILMLFNNVATTVITQGPTQYNFDGKIVMQPDTVNALCDTITGTQAAAAVSLTYAEWPI